MPVFLSMELNLVSLKAALCPIVDLWVTMGLVWL